MGLQLYDWWYMRRLRYAAGDASGTSLLPKLVRKLANSQRGWDLLTALVSNAQEEHATRCRVLSRMGDTDGRFRDVQIFLRLSERNSHPEIAANAVRALGNFASTGSRAAIDRLHELLSAVAWTDDLSQATVDALEGIHGLQSDPLIDLLINAFNSSPIPMNRLRIVRSIRGGDERALDLLARGLITDSDERVREQCSYGLSHYVINRRSLNSRTRRLVIDAIVKHGLKARPSGKVAARCYEILESMQWQPTDPAHIEFLRSCHLSADFLKIKQAEEEETLKRKEKRPRLRVGMTLPEIIALLGEPTSSASGAELLGLLDRNDVMTDMSPEKVKGRRWYTWKRPEGTYTLTFQDGKMVNIQNQPE